MSKAQLKKELAAMDAVQLRELILDVYSARKEAKDYFEFFLNPDVTKLTEKTEAAIRKELNRTKRGRLCARFSKINAWLKEYESFGIDADHVYNLMYQTWSTAVELEHQFYCQAAFVNGTVRLMTRMLEFADKHQLFNVAIVQIDSVISTASRSLRTPMREALASFKTTI